MTVSHTISQQEFDAMAKNEVLRQVKIIQALKDKGIPIVGHIAIERVERGTLSIAFDELFGDTVYSWSE